MSSKKGQAKIPTGEPAATLIALILLLFIFYLLFLPPGEREKILGNETKNKTTTLPTGFVEENLLLKERVGHLEVVADTGKDINFPNFVLTERKPDKVLREMNPFSIKKTLFSDSPKSITFNVDTEKTDLVYMTFQAPRRNGELKVTLNGNVLLQAKLKAVQQRVIFNKELLAKNNELVFSVDGGLFEDKDYQVEDLKIIGSVSEPESLTAENPFRLTSGELDSFESGKLTFHMSCIQQRIGPLTITLNGNTLFSSTPTCDDVAQTELFKEYFNEGKNVLTFKGTKNAYDFDQVRLSLKLTKTKSFLQYFDLSDNLYSDTVTDKFKKVWLEIAFVDNKKQKELEVNVNGRRKAIDQKEKSFKLELTKDPDLLASGRNYVELTPRKAVDIVELRVRVE